MERREQYRTQGGDGDIIAHLRHGQEEVSFGVMNLTSGGAALMVPPHEDPGFKCGQPLRVRFSCSLLTAPIEVHARVVHVQDEVLFRVCGLAFELEMAGQDLPADIRELFNRRRNVRVAPEDREPVDLDLATPEGEWISRARIVDISESGVAIKTLKPARLEAGDLVMASFRLDTSAHPLRVLLNILHGHEDENGQMVYGGEFDVAGTVDFEDQRLVVVAYVIRRQQQLASALP